MAPPPPVARPQQAWSSQFGVALRVEGMTFGTSKTAASNAAMGGAGLSLRYRPLPAFAIDLGVDVLAGNDYNGFSRTEIPLSLNAMIYLNPRSRFQVYLFGGMHVSRAEVKSTLPDFRLQRTDEGEYSTKYTYLGGQGGMGFEFRVSRRVGIFLDGLGFYRGRLGADGTPPEFVDPRNPQRTTNKSAGGLARAGISLWW